MEKIELAIQKARRQTRGGIRTPGAAASARPAAMAPAAAQDREITVDYVDTDVIALNPAHLERNRIVAFSGNASDYWAFDVLRTRVMQKMDENGWRTVAVTSPAQAAGKTVTAINLAISLARQTHRTAMLVDFDLRRPQVGMYLGLRKAVSLNEVLAGQAAMAQAMVNPDLPRLVILPANRPERKSAELLASPRVGQLIDDLRERYQNRVVLFDLPPMLGTDDAMAVLPKIDCVLVVVGNGMSSKRDIEECMRHIPEEKLLGVVMNKAEGHAGQYGYY
jgi:capsular exopolysaccharide synthesis family protein